MENKMYAIKHSIAIQYWYKTLCVLPILITVFIIFVCDSTSWSFSFNWFRVDCEQSMWITLIFYTHLFFISFKNHFNKLFNLLDVRFLDSRILICRQFKIRKRISTFIYLKLLGRFYFKFIWYLNGRWYTVIPLFLSFQTK